MPGTRKTLRPSPSASAAKMAAGVPIIRTRNDLRTQLRFEVGTPDHLRAGVPNPPFVKWLMGFPAGWTQLPPPPAARTP